MKYNQTIIYLLYVLEIYKSMVALYNISYVPQGFPGRKPLIQRFVEARRAPRTGEWKPAPASWSLGRARIIFPNNKWLVGSTPLKKMKVSWGYYSHYMETWQHVPNYQPHYIWFIPIKSSSKRRKFRSQASDNMDRWKAEMEKSEKRREAKRIETLKRSKKNRRKKRQARKKVGEPVKHSVFPMLCGSGGSKSMLAKVQFPYQNLGQWFDSVSTSPC